MPDPASGRHLAMLSYADLTARLLAALVEPGTEAVAAPKFAPSFGVPVPRPQAPPPPSGQPAVRLQEVKAAVPPKMPPPHHLITPQIDIAKKIAQRHAEAAAARRCTVPGARPKVSSVPVPVPALAQGLATAVVTATAIKPDELEPPVQEADTSSGLPADHMDAQRKAEKVAESKANNPRTTCHRTATKRKAEGLPGAGHQKKTRRTGSSSSSSSAAPSGTAGAAAVVEVAGDLREKFVLCGLAVTTGSASLVAGGPPPRTAARWWPASKSAATLASASLLPPCAKSRPRPLPRPRHRLVPAPTASRLWPASQATSAAAAASTAAPEPPPADAAVAVPVVSISAFSTPRLAFFVPRPAGAAAPPAAEGTLPVLVGDSAGNPDQRLEWLLSLDSGKGKFLSYVQRILEHFDDFDQIAAFHLDGPLGGSKIDSVDPYFWTAAGVTKLGDKLMFAAGIEHLWTLGYGQP